MRKKNTSDRKKLKTKYTNQKKRKERRIKLKKDMKKNPNNYHKKKSDPGVPNSAPFKLAMLEERDKYMEQKAQEKEKRRQQILKARMAMREPKPTEKKRKLTDVINLKEPEKEGSDDDEDDSGNDSDRLAGQLPFPEDEMQIDVAPKKRRKTNDGNAVSADVKDMELDDEERERMQARLVAKKLARKAANDRRIFITKHNMAMNKPEQPDPDARFHNWADKVYYKQVKLVVEAADVLLEVVDARDPLGTRCSLLESIIRSRPSKKLVFVLNKADLIPKSNLQAWLKYFRAEGPTVAFKAATHRPRKFKKTINRWVHMGEETLRTPNSMGGDVLLQLLKNYARSFCGAGIVVGVVGLPNVGKSSLINSLKKVKTCEVAPIPGSTKHIKEIKLDKKLNLIDSPGVVLPGEEMDPIDAVLRNLVKLECIRNPVDAALEIFNRSDSLKLALFYEVRKVDTGEEFLANLARRCKKMIKDGISDRDAAAKRLIYDWNHGVLKYYTEPPQRAEEEITTTVVSSLSAAFELDVTASQKEEKFLSYLHDGKPSTTIVLPASKPVSSCYGLDELVSEQKNDESEEEEVESEDQEDSCSDDDIADEEKSDEE